MSAVLLGMGNPLLDISSKVDKDMLDKYGLENGNQILAEEKHLPLYEELAARPDVQYIAGGATQNSIRVAQWMLQEAGQTAYFGCVGSDKYADTMRAVCAKDGIAVHYMVDSLATGTCAVCVVDDDRSLVANLAAANNYKVEHLQEAEPAAVMASAKVIYSAGFFITACGEAVIAAAEHCLANSKTYAVNISAPFICEVPPFKATLDKAIGMADFVFGNETEAAAFGKVEGWECTDVAEIALKISQTKAGAKAPTVVITQGKDATIIAKDGAVTKYDVPPVDQAEIVDTNGAGDAFVGGFLAAFIKGKDTAACCAAGNFSASTIIRTSGTALPDSCSYSWA